MKMRLTSLNGGSFGCGIFLVLACFALAGCGPSGPPEIPVKGKVTFGGGAWPKPATLDFTAVQPAAGMPNKPATAVIEGEGNYSVKLVPGQYVVNVSCWEVEPQPDNPTKAKSYIPDRYATGADRQKLEVPLDAKGPIELSWDIPKN